MGQRLLTRQHRHQGRFARSASTDKRYALRFLNAQADRLQGGNRAVGMLYPRVIQHKSNIALRHRQRRDHRLTRHPRAQTACGQTGAPRFQGTAS